MTYRAVYRKARFAEVNCAGDIAYAIPHMWKTR